MKTIEQRVAEEVVQERIALNLGGVETEAPRPTLATLMRISAVVSTLPELPEGDADRVQVALATADKSLPIAEAVAIALLGEGESKRVRYDAVPRRGILGKLGFTRTVRVEVDMVKELTVTLAQKLNTTQLKDALVAILNQAGIADFFACITFLNGVNILRKVKKKTTAPGR